MLRVPDPKHEHERDDEDVERERYDDAHEPVCDRVDPTTEVAGEQPHRRAEHEREEHGQEGDL